MHDKIKLYIHNVQENVSLAPYTTFKIGGPAKYFVCAKTKEEIIHAIKSAQDAKISFFILGRGSNLLISDKGYDGLIIKIENNDFEKLEDGRVRCSAGLSMSRLILNAKEIGLGGIEYMAGIPSTVGAATNGNAGAWGRGFGEVVEEAEIYKDGNIVQYSKNDLGFVYRGSAIKKNGGVILEVKLKLVPGDKKNIGDEILEIIKKRNKLNIKEPNAGCIFKNIDLKETRVDKEKIMQALDLSEEEYSKATNHDKLPVGFIIDKLGLKEKAIGKVKISECHGAYIVNMGGAQAVDVVMLMSFIKTKVRNELGIQLENEIQLIGF